MTFSPENLALIAKACDALSEPHRRSFWNAPKIIPITTPNNEPIGELVWDSQQQTYRLHIQSSESGS